MISNIENIIYNHFAGTGTVKPKLDLQFHFHRGFGGLVVLVLAWAHFGAALLGHEAILCTLQSEKSFIYSMDEYSVIVISQGKLLFSLKTILRLTEV
jgi:hypothetical protein